MTETLRLTTGLRYYGVMREEPKTVGQSKGGLVIRALVLPTLLGALLLGLPGCKSGKSRDHKPTGSPTDPVSECEKPAQVCKYKGSQLGVCVAKPRSDASCEGESPCFVCVPQH